LAFRAAFFCGARTWLQGTRQGSYRVYPLAAEAFARQLDDLYERYDWQVNAAQLNLLDSHDTARALWLTGDDQSALRLKGYEARRHDAPTHPPFQARFAMIPAAVQAEAAAQHADPPLDTGAKSESPPKPGGPLVGHPCRWRLASIGEWNVREPSRRM